MEKRETPDVLIDKTIDRIDQIEAQWLAIRRELHQWPETGLLEFKTCELIEAKLDQWDISYTRIKPTGIVAWVGTGESPVIGLRADMDALALTEQNDIWFQSKREGYMHGCGHDAHTAGLLAAAYALKQIETHLKGTVKFIFQPAEEICKGANLMLESGLLDDVDKLLGLHVFADIPYGKISMEPGPVMAQTDRFEIHLYGKGGHAAKPQQCIDTTLMAANLVMNLHTIVSRQVNPVDSAVLTVGSLKSGTQYNIISGEAVLEGTVRSFDENTAISIMDSMARMTEHTAKMYGGQWKIVNYPTSHPPLINNETVAKEAKQTFEKVFGPDVLYVSEKLMLGEDFSNYQKRIPSAFAFVGGGKEEGENYPNHHPRFDIDERSIGMMAKCYAAYALDQMA